MRRTVILAAMLLTTCLAASAEEASRSATAQVTYVTGSSIYIDAGKDDGLAAGDRLEVIRGESVIAVVEVRELSNRRAVCTVVEKGADLAIGDTVRYAPRAAPAEPPPMERPARRSTKSSLRDAGLRGRIGVRFLWVHDRSGQSADYSQPALDLRLDGSSIAGTPWGLAVDVRARRTYRNLSDGTSDDDGRTRLYRLAVSRRGTDDPWIFTLGRQYSPALAAISIFDGLSAEYASKGWAAGLFSGTQPDVEDFGYSSDIREHGVYFRLHGRPAPRRGWQVSTGLIGSYDQSEVNREFVYLQGRYNGPKFSVYAAEEVDFNRDWKKAEGADSVSVTSSFVTLSYRAGQSFSIRGGFDNRRNVRLNRDRITPVTEFDDTFRQGVWAGAAWSFLRSYRVGLDVRTHGGGNAGDSDTYTLTFGATRLGDGPLSLHSRSSRYTNDRLEGWLHAVDLGVELGRRTHLRLGGGVRDEDDLAALIFGNRLTWYGFDVDLALGRHWYLIFSAERTDGDLEEVDQLYSTLTYRF